jgi:7-carboxy-7-deazaguanine synthase
VSPSDTTTANTRPVSSTGERLRITEIFFSLQGEARTVGCPTVFIRLTGCPLRCSYCDTEYAFYGGQWMEFSDILRRVAEYIPRYVTVTGGALDVGGIDPRVSIVMDLKTPGSGEASRNLYANLAHLTKKDQVKFVICDRADYEWSRTQLAEHRLDRLGEVLFSPCYGQLNPTDLAEWILADRLPVRLQVQLHKLLWNDARGH